jgi:hypothetical protein
VAFGQFAGISVDDKQLNMKEMKIFLAPGSALAEEKAALELQKYLRQVTGIFIPVTYDPVTSDPQGFILGRAGREAYPRLPEPADPDGFIIKTIGKAVVIDGGSDQGTLYGVYDFLERYLGCNFWAPDAESVPARSRLDIPAIDVRETPAFASREVYYAGMAGQEFAGKMRSDRHAWKGGGDWGLWVHTMFTLVPPEKYFATHPEYYALMAGIRCTTQLCLSNPEVLKITVDALRARMQEKPGAKYWSVSQMDTYGNCACAECKATDDREGSASGSLIAFINKVAAEFPDKVISTLAYQYTRKAPRNLRPSPNVNIMLCTIECDRSRPLESDSSEGSFVHDLRSWAAISGNILVWDYVIQFTNMLAPFPNLPVLQPNLQLFHKYGVRAVFEQGCHGTYSENQELRQYLLAKLLWNPDLNVDSLTNLFLNGYYGKAGPFMGQYLQGMESSLRKSGKTLWIYGSPMQETDAFLDSASMETFNALFARAAAAVAGDTVLENRVAKARLPLQYATIEISKRYITGPQGFLMATGPDWTVNPAMIGQVNDFVMLAERYGVKTLHERSLPPAVYGEQTIHFFRTAYTRHLATGRPYVLTAPPSPKYSAEGPGSLTDGKRGSANYYVLWQGFESVDLEATADLGSVVDFNYVGAEFLQDISSWIFYPEQVTVSVSADGAVFREVAAFNPPASAEPVLIQETGKKIAGARARYVRFYARNVGKCPPWHIGHGGKAWLFVDELIVDRRD